MVSSEDVNDADFLKQDLRVFNQGSLGEEVLNMADTTQEKIAQLASGQRPAYNLQNE